MKVRLIFVFIILIICSCKSKAEFKIINGDSLLLKRVVIIEEKQGDTSISDIINFSCNSDGQFIVLTDKTQRKIFIYNSYTGEIIKYLETSIYFQDSILYSSEISRIHPDVEMFSMSDYLSQFHEDSISKKIKKLEKESYTRFFSAYFYNDSIIGINSQIDLLYFLYRNEKPELTGAGLPYLIKFNIKNGEFTFLPFYTYFKEKNFYDYSKNEFISICIEPRLDISFFDDNINLYITNCINKYAREKNNYDSLWSLAYYDLNGNFVKEIDRLPREYYDLNFFYNVCTPRLILDNNKDIITAYPIVCRIFNVTKNKTFEMSNLKQGNDRYFKYILESKDIKKRPNEVIQNIPVFINDLYLTSKGNYLIYFYEREFDSNLNITYFQYVLQEYSTDGILLNQIHFSKENKNGLLRRLFYSIPDKSIVISRVSEDVGLTLEYYDWE